MEDRIILPTIRKNYNPFFSNLFDDNFFFGTNGHANTLPAVNIKETDKSFNLEVAVPGMKKEDLKIEVNDDVLTISSENKYENKEEKDGYKRKEFCYSSFCRSFYLPENTDVDGINASYKDGILDVTIPKKEEDQIVKIHKISIS